YRADGIAGRIEAERVVGVHHSTSLKVRCACQVDDAIYGACRCVHDPFRRVHHLCPLGAYALSRIKLPDLIGGGYVDIEPAEYVQLVVSHCETTRQDRAYDIPGPVVCTGEGGCGVGRRVVEEYARGGCGLPSSGTAHTIDIRRA